MRRLTLVEELMPRFYFHLTSEDSRIPDEAAALANQVVKNHIIEPIGIPPLDVQREEISRRVQLFKARQQRLTKDREDYAASIVNRMRDLGR
jgi:hypothetical protein